MDELSFETAIKRLEELVTELERGECPLEDCMKLYEEGVHLTVVCAEKLQAAEQKLVTLDGGGEVRA